MYMLCICIHTYVCTYTHTIVICVHMPNLMQSDLNYPLTSSLDESADEVWISDVSLHNVHIRTYSGNWLRRNPGGTKI